LEVEDVKDKEEDRSCTTGSSTLFGESPNTEARAVFRAVCSICEPLKISIEMPLIAKTICIFVYFISLLIGWKAVEKGVVTVFHDVYRGIDTIPPSLGGTPSTALRQRQVTSTALYSLSSQDTESSSVSAVTREQVGGAVVTALQL
jgi:hypothetical protein